MQHLKTIVVGRHPVNPDVIQLKFANSIRNVKRERISHLIRPSLNSIV